MPGTAYLEIARAAFAEHTKGDVLELSDFYFLNIFRLGDSEVKEAHTLLEKNGNGYRFVVRSKTNPADVWQDHVVGIPCQSIGTRGRRSDSRLRRRVG